VGSVPRAVGGAWRRRLLTWLITSILQVIHRAISTFLIKQAELKRSEAQTGAITLIQRFGSAANLNIHLHCLVLDSVYRIQNGVAEFCSVQPPTAEQLQSLLSQIIKRIMKALTRNGALIEEGGMSYLAEMETDAALALLQSAACKRGHIWSASYCKKKFVI